MSIFTLIVVLVVVAVLLWLVPMDAVLRRLLIAVAVIAFAVWLLFLLRDLL
jgi:hypothetical protein